MGLVVEEFVYYGGFWFYEVMFKGKNLGKGCVLSENLSRWYSEKIVKLEKKFFFLNMLNYWNKKG